MKFTPTAIFTAISNGAVKCLSRKYYIRKVSVLNTALSSGTWTEVTDRLLAHPRVAQDVEISIGISTAGSLSFQSANIAWWKANVFNASASEFIEFKLEAKIGLDASNLTSDLAYVACGFVDKNPEYDNNADSVSFSVYSADDLLSRLAGENLTTQIINEDVDGGGTDGLMLLNIPGVWVTDANISSYVLAAGVHTITFDYNGGTEQAKLDDGAYVTLAGSTVLVNADGTQKVEVYADSALFLTSGTATQEIIVTTYGDTIPYTWYQNVWAFQMLRAIYALAGIDNYTFDNFQIATYDGRKTLSFFESPPGGGSFYKKAQAISYDPTTHQLFIGVGDRLYAREFTNHTYTLIGTPSTGYNIVRLWAQSSAAYNTVVGIGFNGSAFKAFEVDLSDNSMVVTTITVPDERCIVYCDSDDYPYSLVYNGGDGYVKVFDISTATESNFNSTIIDDTLVSPSAAFFDGVDYYYCTGIENSGPAPTGIVRVGTGGSDFRMSLSGGMEEGILLDNGISQTFYFYHVATGKIKSYTGGTSTTDIDTALGFAFTTDNTKVYFVRQATSSDPQKLAYISSGTVTVEADEINRGADKITAGDHLAWDPDASRYLFIYDASSILAQYDDHASMYIGIESSYGGQSLRDALNEVLQAFMLLGIISGDKTAKVYRRSDDAGDPVTSGNTLTLTVNNSENIVQAAQYSQAVAWVEVSNNVETHSYDGTNWDMAYIGMGRKLTLTNRLISDGIVKDLAYYLYQYFSVDRSLYTVPMSLVLPLQHECFDEASLSFTGSKVLASLTGPIYGTELSEDGRMTIKVVA